MLALSIRQPYAELILRGMKPVEFRSRRTRIIGARSSVRPFGIRKPNTMSKIDFKISGNDLELKGGARVHFDHPVSDVVEVAGVLVVALDVMSGVLPRNVFGVSDNGNILWQIEDVQPNRNNDRYVGLVALSDSVLANRWDDLHVWLDPRTGRVLKEERSKS
jgi:hypothetical protein